MSMPPDLQLQFKLQIRNMKLRLFRTSLALNNHQSSKFPTTNEGSENQCRARQLRALNAITPFWH